MDKKALILALEELVRVIIIAVIPVVVDSLNRGTIDGRTLAVVGAIAGLRFIEKYLYKSNPDNTISKFLSFQ